MTAHKELVESLYAERDALKNRVAELESTLHHAGQMADMDRTRIAELEEELEIERMRLAARQMNPEYRSAALNDLTGPMAFGEPKMNNETKPDAPAKGFTEIRRDQVFAAINSERIYQELKWGTLEEHPQSVGAYITLMRVHLDKAADAWADSFGDEKALDRLRRVLAIGVACGEQHGMLKRDYSSVNYGDS